MRRLHGAAFQNFFSDLMEALHGSDFIRVKPGGPEGDRKCDGILVSSRQLFGVYAPEEMNAKTTVGKIEADFHGAIHYWNVYFDEWVFVHNALEGLLAPVTEELLLLRYRGAKQVTPWGFAELLDRVYALSDEARLRLLGPLPADLEAAKAVALSAEIPLNRLKERQALLFSHRSSPLERFRSEEAITDDGPIFDRLIAPDPVTVTFADGDPVKVSGGRYWSDRVAVLDLTDAAGHTQKDVVVREDSVAVVTYGMSGTMTRYPRGVPSLFSDIEAAMESWRVAHQRGRTGEIIDAYLSDIALRLSAPHRRVGLRPVDHAGTLGTERADHAIIWGIVHSPEEARSLALRAAQTGCLAVAVDVTDPWWPSPPSAGMPARPGTGVVVVTPAALMLTNENARTLLEIGAAVDRSAALELVEFGPAAGTQWHRIPTFPHAFELDRSVEADPTFYVDIFNHKTTQVRLYGVYVAIRFRHMKLHGIPQPGLLTPTCTVELPVEHGMAAPYRGRLEAPILVEGGSYCRILVRLSGTGTAWRGELDLGFYYDGGVLVVPSLSIFC